MISITGPTLGVVTGGIVLNKLGGYENPKIIKLLFITSFIVDFNLLYLIQGYDICSLNTFFQKYWIRFGIFMDFTFPWRFYYACALRTNDFFCFIRLKTGKLFYFSMLVLLISFNKTFLGFFHLPFYMELLNKMKEIMLPLYY